MYIRVFYESNEVIKRAEREQKENRKRAEREQKESRKRAERVRRECWERNKQCKLWIWDISVPRYQAITRFTQGECPWCLLGRGGCRWLLSLKDQGGCPCWDQGDPPSVFRDWARGDHHCCQLEGILAGPAPASIFSLRWTRELMVWWRMSLTRCPLSPGSQTPRPRWCPSTTSKMITRSVMMISDEKGFPQKHC